MNDNYKNLRGHITVQSIDKNGNVVDEFKDPNLIMDLARTSIRDVLSGIGSIESFDKFTVGTEGHVDGDYLTAKTSAEGFTDQRTELFSEESVSTFYPITFSNPGTSAGPCTVSNLEGTGLTDGCTVDLVASTTQTTYTILIPVNAGNFTGTTVYTEAALYTGTNIFSMKTFTGKIKDNTVSLKIIWTITF